MSDEKYIKNKQAIPNALAEELAKHKLKLSTYEPVKNPEPKEDQFNSDAEADADALSSAGFGTDEDYGSASEVL
jgi:hypothetical protein